MSGFPTLEVCKHAPIPALLTYGALFYAVDLEATKAGMTGLTATSWRTPGQGLVKAGLTLSSLIILANIVYFGLGLTKLVFGGNAGLIAIAVAFAVYVALVRIRARNLDLPADDLRYALVKVPDFYEVARTGLHYLIPVVVSSGASWSRRCRRALLPSGASSRWRPWS